MRGSPRSIEPAPIACGEALVVHREVNRTLPSLESVMCLLVLAEPVNTRQLRVTTGSFKKKTLGKLNIFVPHSPHTRRRSSCFLLSSLELFQKATRSCSLEAVSSARPCAALAGHKLLCHDEQGAKNYASAASSPSSQHAGAAKQSARGRGPVKTSSVRFLLLNLLFHIVYISSSLTSTSPRQSCIPNRASV